MFLHESTDPMLELGAQFDVCMSSEEAASQNLNGPALQRSSLKPKDIVAPLNSILS